MPVVRGVASARGHVWEIRATLVFGAVRGDHPSRHHVGVQHAGQRHPPARELHLDLGVGDEIEGAIRRQCQDGGACGRPDQHVRKDIQDGKREKPPSYLRMATVTERAPSFATSMAAPTATARF